MKVDQQQQRKKTCKINNRMIIKNRFNFRLIHRPKQTPEILNFLKLFEKFKSNDMIHSEEKFFSFSSSSSSNYHIHIFHFHFQTPKSLSLSTQ